MDICVCAAGGESLPVNLFLSYSPSVPLVSLLVLTTLCILLFPYLKILKNRRKVVERRKVGHGVLSHQGTPVPKLSLITLHMLFQKSLRPVVVVVGGVVSSL